MSFVGNSISYSKGKMSIPVTLSFTFLVRIPVYRSFTILIGSLGLDRIEVSGTRKVTYRRHIYFQRQLIYCLSNNNKILEFKTKDLNGA